MVSVSVRPHPMTDARVQCILQDDAAQFQLVPGTLCFLRQYYPGEFVGVSMPREMRLDAVNYVLVKRLNGAQLRVPMTTSMASLYIEAMQERLHGCIVRKMALLLPSMSEEHTSLVLAYLQALVSVARLTERPDGQMKVSVECTPMQEKMFRGFVLHVFDAKRFEE